MAFEKIMLNQVERVLKTPHQASFTNGTLFVDNITFEESQKILRKLAVITKVEKTRIGTTDEYAYDFVA